MEEVVKVMEVMEVVEVVVMEVVRAENAYSLVKFDFDIAENEPSEVPEKSEDLGDGVVLNASVRGLQRRS